MHRSQIVLMISADNPGASHGPTGEYFGVFAAGAHGLVVTNNNCIGCAHPDHKGGPHVCRAVGTGLPPHANSSVEQGSLVDIRMNTEDFEATR